MVAADKSGPPLSDYNEPERPPGCIDGLKSK
jgi:hypothetical protein